MRKALYNIFGFISLSLGFVGAFLPILPTVPLLLMASYFFSKGSKRFDKWFRSTKLYKKHLEEFVNNREMTLSRKLVIVIPVSIILIFTAIKIDNIIARLGIFSTILYIYYYFTFKIKTKKTN